MDQLTSLPLDLYYEEKKAGERFVLLILVLFLLPQVSTPTEEK